jgi:hypothetical protein
MWFQGMGASWLDVRLGIRMLFLHPGLTLVAVFALSIGIPASLIPIHIIDALVLLAIVCWNVATLIPARTSTWSSEIAIRTALGASPARIVFAIARWAFLQLVAGTAAGVGLALWFLSRSVDDPATYVIGPGGILAECASFMFVAGIMACVAPTVRGLRIQPVEAL